MKPLLRSFGIFIQQIIRDYMLWAVCLVPLLTAFIFRFGVPYVEILLCSYFKRQTILSDYYLIFDLLLCLNPSFMVCFASAMVMLAEQDENMASYMAVTPVGKTGYVLSRLIFPAVIAYFFALLLTYFFALTDWNLLMLSEASLGMAVAKMTSLLFIGLAVPFFILSDVQYIAAILPTFWVAKLCKEGNSFLMLPALAVSLTWIVLLAHRFK